MYLIFEKASRELVDWQRTHPANKPTEDHPIIYEDDIRVVISAPNWTPGTITYENGERIVQNDRYITKDFQIRTITPKRIARKQAKRRGNALNKDFTKTINERLTKLSLKASYIFEIGRIAQLMKDGETPDIGFTIDEDKIDIYIMKYKRLLRRLHKLYRRKKLIKDILSQDKKVDEIEEAFNEAREELEESDDDDIV